MPVGGTETRQQTGWAVADRLEALSDYYRARTRLTAREPEFKRELPLGTYKVDVRATPAGKTTAVRVRGFVEVMRDEVVQQKPAVILGAR